MHKVHDRDIHKQAENADDVMKLFETLPTFKQIAQDENAWDGNDILWIGSNQKRLWG